MGEKIHLQAGERPMQDAPVVTLPPGTQCIPQHYLMYDHTLASVEQVVLDIDFDPHFPVFVCPAADHIYIQVGVVGKDNYVSRGKQAGNKIVYGRKWRIEPQLPTSEIVQTVFLALQKAREHEVRERFRLCHNGRCSTPFNTHHDAPLMATVAAQGYLVAAQQQPSACKKTQLNRWLEQIRYDDARFTLKAVSRHTNGQYLLDLDIVRGQHSALPELDSSPFTLLLDTLSQNALYHALLSQCLMLSNRYVEEHFSYKGFRRFSQSNAVTRIAELSSLTRQRESQATGQTDHFHAHFSQANYDTDRTRVPKVSDSALGHRLMTQLAALDIREGILPQKASLKDTTYVTDTADDAVSAQHKQKHRA